MGSSHDGLIIPLGGRGQKMSVSRLAVISSGQALRLSVCLLPPLPPPTPSVSCPAFWLKSLLSLSLSCSFHIENLHHSGIVTSQTPHGGSICTVFRLEY